MYKSKNVLVVGVARSGIGAANMLNKLGANVTINDIKTSDDLNDQLGLLDDGINIVLGCKADDLVLGKNLVVVSPGIPAKLSFFRVAKENNIPVISEVELSYTVCKAPIAAITGTNGKTTTTALVGFIFSHTGKDTFIVGNIGDAFSNKVLEMKQDSLVALEVSSFQMETIDTFKPKVSAILNITEDHLARHGTMDEYIRCKKRIFENQTEDDFLVLNYDDEILKSISNEGKCKKIFFSKFDIDYDSACVVNDTLVIKDNNQIYNICKVNEIALPGIHNLENSLAAAAISYFYGVNIDSIAYGIMNFKAVEHRLEYVSEHNGIRYINDSKATNTDATMWAVRAMDRPTIIILGGYEKGSEFDELITEFNEYIKGAVVIGQTKNKIISSLKKHGFSNYKTCDGFDEAVYTAVEMSHEGYNVLLSPACASYDMFKDYEKRGLRFKEIIKEIKGE